MTKKLLTAFWVVAMIFGLISCQNISTDNKAPDATQAVKGPDTPVPFSRGPNGPPSVKGPTAPPDFGNTTTESATGQAVTQKEPGTFTLPQQN